MFCVRQEGYLTLATMNNRETLSLRDRTFRVINAQVIPFKDTWQIEIETDGQDFNGEWWAPRLYHQGLILPSQNGQELDDLQLSWETQDGAGYLHPELGIMYVFGHHAVRDCSIKFGKFKSGRIEISWKGVCDIFWDGEYSDNVPFACSCTAIVGG